MCDKICAGIVLFNPERELLKRNIEALRKQIDFIILYDNGSENSDEIYGSYKDDADIRVICNKKNYGIAKGLNELLEIAFQKGYDWCLTMDQDSICSNKLIVEYRKVIKQYKNVALVCPFVLNNGKYSMDKYKELSLPKFETIMHPIDCITSACLNNVEIIRNIGGYKEELFIDYVDTEINCRVLHNGYSIIRANRAYMIQQMGNGKRIHLLSRLYKLTNNELVRRMQTVSVYNDMRLYYESRNSRYIRSKYPEMEPRLSCRFMLLMFTYFSIFYPLSRNRIKMWTSIIRGWRDAPKLMD